jgi:hypothetical protein
MPPVAPPAPATAAPPSPPAAPPPPGPKPAAAPPETPAAPVKPAINVAAHYREIGTIRILAMIFMFITASLSILSSFISTGGMTALSGAGIGLTVFGIVLGFLAIINQKNRRLNNLTTIGSVALLLAGVTTRPAMLAMGKLNLGSADFILSLLFAVFFLLFLEYTHGVRRFWEIGEMAIEKNLKEFDFGHVLRQYIVMGFVWLVVIVIITMLVVALQLGLVSYLPAQLGKSAEMNSVYGLAVAEGLVFVILAVILIIVMGLTRGEFTSRKAEVRAAPTGPAMPGAQVYMPGQSPQQTGLSSTAPPPRAQG